MRPTAAFQSAGPQGRAAATRAARATRATVAASILPLVLAFAWASPADAAPRNARPHAAAKPAVGKAKPAAGPRPHGTPARPAAKNPARRAEMPQAFQAPHAARAPQSAAMPTPLPARSDPGRPRRPAATVKDPGTRDDVRAARVACERDGRIYFLEDCARPEPAALRTGQALAESR